MKHQILVFGTPILVIERVTTKDTGALIHLVRGNAAHLSGQWPGMVERYARTGNVYQAIARIRHTRDVLYGVWLGRRMIGCVFVAVDGTVGEIGYFICSSCTGRGYAAVYCGC